MNINITAPINSTSYGLVSLNLMKRLHSLGHKIAWWPIGPTDSPQENVPILQELFNNQQLFSRDAPSVRIFHQFDLAQHVASPRIGFPIFELDTFNDIEKNHLLSQHELFVCSNWAENIVRSNNLHTSKYIHVIPLGVDRQIFSYAKMNMSKTTRFFNAGKWEIRKGHDILVEAFNEAFDKHDDVELHMLPNNIFLKDHERIEWESLYKHSKMGHKIHIHGWMNTQHEVAQWMNSMDCGVFPSRAEGWNLELLECLSCGRHAIATDYSAHTEFINKDNCRLISPKENCSVEMAYDGKWFFGQGNWLNFDSGMIDTLVKHMQNIHKEKQANGLGMNVCGVETARKFTWGNSADKFVEAINDILQRNEW